MSGSKIIIQEALIKRLILITGCPLVIGSLFAIIAPHCFIIYWSYSLPGAEFGWQSKQNNVSRVKGYIRSVSESFRHRVRLSG